MVLIRRHRLLVASLAPEREPAPGARWFAQIADRELDQSPGHRVNRHSDHVADQNGIELGVDELSDGFAESPPLGRDAFVVGRAFDRRAQREGGRSFQPHEVRVRYDADDGASVAEHRKVVHTVLKHRQEGLFGGRSFGHGDQRRTHDVLDQDIGPATLRDDARPQVAIGDDAVRPAPDDQERRHALGHHPTCGLVNGLVGPTDDGRSAHERSDRYESRIRSIRIAKRESTHRSTAQAC
jgi:hypothetical protein